MGYCLRVRVDEWAYMGRVQTVKTGRRTRRLQQGDEEGFKMRRPDLVGTEEHEWACLVIKDLCRSQY